MKAIFQEINGLIQHGESFILAMVLTSTGSTPRAAGARMVVYKDGHIGGTIGGGILEALVQRRAAEVFESKKDIVIPFNLSNQDAGQIGMLCGGNVRILLEYVQPDDKAKLMYVPQLLESLAAHRKAWLVTPVPGETDSLPNPRHCLYDPEMGFTDCWGLKANDLDAIIHLMRGRIPAIVSYQGNDYLIEPVFSQGTVYLFGGGHISQKLCPLASLVGFNTVVMDDRDEFVNRDIFPGADRLVRLENFDKALVEGTIDQDSYLVIVTRGHAHDKTVLEQALRTEAGYIGMIGSKTKREATYKALIDSGVPPAALERVYSPIGLAIGAETPEEIAISILAELIKVRAGV